MYNILAWQFYLSNVSSYSLLPCKFSADGFMGVPLYVTSFVLIAFKFLPLTFDNLIIMCVGIVPFGMISFGSFAASWI